MPGGTALQVGPGETRRDPLHADRWDRVTPSFPRFPYFSPIFSVTPSTKNVVLVYAVEYFFISILFPYFSTISLFPYFSRAQNPVATHGHMIVR